MNSHTTVAAMFLIAGAGAAAAGLSPWRQFDAALDTPGDTAWENTGSLQGGQAQNFSFATAQSPVSVENCAPSIRFTSSFIGGGRDLRTHTSALSRRRVRHHGGVHAAV